MAWQSTFKSKPKPINAEEKAMILGVYMASGGNAIAAKALGMSERKWDCILDAYPELREEVNEAKEFCVEYAQQALFNMGTKSKNVAALIFWLKNRAGWTDKREISGSVDLNLIPRLIMSHASELPQTNVTEELPEATQRCLPPTPTRESSAPNSSDPPPQP